MDYDPEDIELDRRMEYEADEADEEDDDHGCCDCANCDYMDYRDAHGRHRGEDVNAVCAEHEIIVSLDGPACGDWYGA